MPVNKFGGHATYKRKYEEDGFDEEVFNMKGKRIIEIAEPLNDSDAVNKKYLQEATTKIYEQIQVHITSTNVTTQRIINLIRELTKTVHGIKIFSPNVKKLDSEPPSISAQHTTEHPSKAETRTE